MKKEFKKQAAIGIAGVFGTVLTAWGVYAIWGMPENRWVLYALLAAAAACFFGFLLFIFSGKRGFFKGAQYGFGFVALTVAAKELPVWLFGILIVAAVFVFIVLPLIRQYKLDREKSCDKVVNKKLAAEIRLEESIEDDVRQEDDEFKKSIGFGEKSLLLLANVTGAMYQLIRSGDRLYFVRIGGELSGLDAELVRTVYADEASLMRGAKDFYISPNEIDEITCKYGRAIGTPMDNCGELKIKTHHKRYTFAILDHLSQEKLAAFFTGLPFAVKAKKRADAPTHALTAEDKRILPTLKKACLALTVSSFIFGAAFLFLPIGPVIYRILSAICMLIPVITSVLYARHNALLSVEEERNDERVFKKTHVNIMLPLLIPSAVLGLRTIYDFSVTGWASLLIWSGAVAAAILLLLFMFTKEYKRRKSVIALFVLVTLFYAPSAVLQVNGLYDNSTPVVTDTVLLDKRISDGRNSTFYYFTVELDNGEEADLGVTPEFYEMREAGDAVTVVEQSGLLGVDYAYIDEGE